MNTKPCDDLTMCGVLAGSPGFSSQLLLGVPVTFNASAIITANVEGSWRKGEKVGGLQPICN